MAKDKDVADRTPQQLRELAAQKETESKRKKKQVEEMSPAELRQLADEIEEECSATPTLRECLLWNLEEKDLDEMLAPDSARAKLIARILKKTKG